MEQKRNTFILFLILSFITSPNLMSLENKSDLFPISNRGTEFPVHYEKYGTFEGVGTPEYKYRITNRKGLRKAMGAGLYPSIGADISQDEDYKKWRQENRGHLNPWDFVNTGDPQSDYYGWITARGTKPGTKLFFAAEALAQAGHYELALKAYYASFIHFPKEPCYSADRRFVWYPASRALSKIEALTKHVDGICYQLKGASYKIKNGKDTNLKNDVVTVNPGKWVPYDPKARVDVDSLKIVKQRGEGRVQVVQFENKHWQLRVDGEPFIVKGLSYNPTKVGRDIADHDGSRWMHEDADNNGWLDTPYDSWVDVNLNNRRDYQEKGVGDFSIMKEMGANTIRLYRFRQDLDYDPSEFNKKLLRDMNKQYGIFAIMGDFLGAYTVGSGASWEVGTDYTNKKQLTNMKQLVRDYVLDHKDEPYVLMWLLGNENLMPADYSGVNATRTQASTHVKAYLKFVNEVAKMIKKLDPNHPVAVGNLALYNLEEHGKYAPHVDIFGSNSYRGSLGFENLWSEVQKYFDRPVLITEYGCDAFDSKKNKPDLKAQKDYHKNAWNDILLNSAGGVGNGNAIGGIVFEYLDEWWKSQKGSRKEHDKKKDSPMAFPDGWSSEEWFGIFAQGDGTHSPFIRQPRPVYYLYRDELWN